MIELVIIICSLLGKLISNLADLKSLLRMKRPLMGTLLLWSKVLSTKFIVYGKLL